jgi:citrate synthase
MKKPTIKVQSRNERFAEKAGTHIWQETASPDNPYITERCLCHGYDLLELMRHRGLGDMVYLMLRGELPTEAQRELLETLMVALSNPGPRHPATRAAMTAGISKADTAHILPIGLSVLSGAHLGAGEVEASMRFIRRHRHKEPVDIADELIQASAQPDEGDWHIAPGFGTRFGGIDIMPGKVAALLLEQEVAGTGLRWSAAFASHLHEHGSGWLFPGVAAAAFLDLGFHPRVGAGLFQLACAPGLLAQGLEMANRPITAMPFIDQEHFFIDEAE